jgi:cobalamin synthase
VFWNHSPSQSHYRGQAAGHASQRRAPYPNRSTTQEIVMTLTAAHLSPIVALIAGILILILPSLLNYVVAIYLIVTGLIGLNGIYHFIN